VREAEADAAVSALSGDAWAMDGAATAAAAPVRTVKAAHLSHRDEVILLMRGSSSAS
jgi:hypothetical protein